jgi:opacity protein-like surface antigen
MRSIRLVTCLTSLGLVATLRAASPTPAEEPVATPASAGTSHSLKDIVPVESPGVILSRRNGFEVVPGKDPNGWSFILEPYLWGLGVDGTVGVKGFDTHVDYNPLTVVKHLDWGIMAKGEVRKGKWGILGDGFFAQPSASGDPPGPLYNNANIKLQQGMAELALAYRIIDDRRGFLDIYAGARYNYFGINTDASVDDAGVQDVSNEAARRLFRAVGARVQSAVEAEAQRLRVQLADERAVLREDVRVEEAILREDVRVEETVLREDLRIEETVAREDIRARIAASLEPDLLTRLARDLASNHLLRDATRSAEILRTTKGVRSEFRALLNAVLDLRLAENRARVDARLAEARVRVDVRLAEARARIAARVAQARANAQARVAQAEKKFSKALSKELEDRLPTSRSGDGWWVDPIVGLRGQINFTRWLFLALQGDVGGFGAGSQIAWFASGSIGVNFTRNLFAEMGYRYFFMDYEKNGLTYDAAQSGLFMGIGVKFLKKAKLICGPLG